MSTTNQRKDSELNRFLIKIENTEALYFFIVQPEKKPTSLLLKFLWEFISQHPKARRGVEKRIIQRAYAAHPNILAEKEYSTLSEWSIEKILAYGTALNDSGVTTLSLRNNSLNYLSPEQWQALGAALKDSGVTTLDLRDNFLSNLSPEQWQTFCDVLKDSGVTKLIVSSNALPEKRLDNLKERIDYNFLNNHRDPKSDEPTAPSLLAQCYRFIGHSKEAIDALRESSEEIVGRCENQVGLVN